MFLSPRGANLVIAEDCVMKSKLVSESLFLDKKTNLVLIRELSINDPELYEIISAQKAAAREDFVKRALRVGAVALRDAVVSSKLDLIERKFQRLCVEMDTVLRSKLGKEGMEGELERVFGDEGELQRCLEEVFGDRGKLVRDILDMDNKNSPIGRLRERMESYFVGKESEIYSMLDPNRENSPICRLRTDIMDELDRIKTTIEGQIVKKEVMEKSTQKGFTFEDMLEDYLLFVTKPFHDTVERVGTEKGKLGNLKGDLLVTVCDPTVRGRPPRIVVEAKAGENVRLTRKGLLGELDEALKNREADFAIAVTKSLISDSVGSYREIPPDKIVCTFADDGLPLEVAYKVARARVLLSLYEELEKEIDVARIKGIIGKIRDDLKTASGIKAKLTGIGRASEDIKEDIDSLEINIRDSLKNLVKLLKNE